MASTTSTVDADSITVVVRSAFTTSHTHTPYFPPFPPKKFVSSTVNHGLPRTGLKGVSDQTRFVAAMDAISCLLEELSLSERPARQETAPTGCLSSIDTSARAESTTSNNSLRRKSSNSGEKIFARCAQNVRASFKRMVLKSGEKTKKTRGASRPSSGCSSQAEALIGQRGESVPGHSMLEALEANQHPQGSRFCKMFSFEGRPNQGVGDLTFSAPISFDIHPSNPFPTGATIGLAGLPMEDVQQPSSLLPTSPVPIPMEVEVGLPSSSATSVPEPRQTPFEPSIDRKLDAPSTDSSDTVMGDSEEDVSRATEVMQQTEAGSRTLVDSVSTKRLSSTPSNQDVDMEDADNSRRFTSLQQPSTPLPPAVRNEASKELEAKAFLAQLKTSRPPVKSQPKPAPPPTSSEPKKTKGSSARSLMDDIIAEFRSATKGKPSNQQVAMAVDPPAQSRPVPTTTLHASLAVLPKPPRRTPVVAGRQPGPQPTPPRHVGTGSEATAPGGSLIPTSRAPSTVPTIGKVNGPSAGNQVQVGFTPGAAPSGTALDAAMDGVESGRAVKGSRRAARAIARTGWTLETAQQKTREAQAAQNLENNIEVAPPPANSLKAFEERAKSSAWHAAQPPPPPEAMPYIAVGKKIRRATYQETSG